MSSATPMASSVSEVLLNTWAPTGSVVRTTSLASAPDSTTRLRTPARSRAAAAERIVSSGGSDANSVTTSSLGAGIRGSVGALIARRAPGSVCAELGETLVRERDGHGSFADRGRTTLDRPAADIARGEDTGAVRFERQRRARQG